MRNKIIISLLVLGIPFLFIFNQKVKPNLARDVVFPDQQVLPCPVEGLDIDGSKGEAELAASSLDSPFRFRCNDTVFTLSVPPSCAKGGCGLIVDSHGIVMTAESENMSTRMRELAWNAEVRGASSPYIVIQPNTYDSPKQRKAILDFMTLVIKRWSVDASRIHYGGFSMGGMITQAFLCEHNEWIASFALMGAPFVLACEDGGVPNNPRMEIMGRYDINHYLLRIDNRRRSMYLKAMGERYQEQVLHASSGELGDYQHTRYQSGSDALADDVASFDKKSYLYEHISHNAFGGALGFSLIDGGHCIPNKENFTWVSCPAAFSAGEKMLDFYIANPQRHFSL